MEKASWYNNNNAMVGGPFKGFQVDHQVDYRCLLRAVIRRREKVLSKESFRLKHLAERACMCDFLEMESELKMLKAKELKMEEAEKELKWVKQIKELL
ncbi:conserved hypothetical protein [Ricinus communis]|uniref:Uncharacterized protein n=1 Tax=Ricinus communis TaxID=3988 RepID=B9RSI2_RICCO|nr:conserved hypothetical protein [Ricinus communis]